MTAESRLFTIGETFSEVVVTNLTRTQIVKYAGSSDDFNPLHTDEVFATQVANYPSVIAHGMLTMGLTGKALTNLVGDGRLTTFGGRFVGVVQPGDDLVAHMHVTGTDDSNGDTLVSLRVATVNQRGEAVFTGTATALVDKSGNTAIERGAALDVRPRT